MRLIDADTLLLDNTWEWYDEYGNLTQAGKAVHEAPTVDAVEVVRCKDCKWGSFLTHTPPWTHYCLRDPKEAPSKQAEDFCSYGERKDE